MMLKQHYNGNGCKGIAGRIWQSNTMKILPSSEVVLLLKEGVTKLGMHTEIKMQGESPRAVVMRIMNGA